MSVAPESTKLLKVGTEEIKSKGKGVVIDEGHYLGDGLWRMHLD
jgi:predicted ribosome-associated RNA-binding protein Tma20